MRKIIRLVLIMFFFKEVILMKKTIFTFNFFSVALIAYCFFRLFLFFYKQKLNFHINSNQFWLLKRYFRLLEKIILALLLSVAFFKLLIDPPFMITFFKITIILSIMTITQECLLLIYQKIKKRP